MKITILLIYGNSADGREPFVEPIIQVYISVTLHASTADPGPSVLPSDGSTTQRGECRAVRPRSSARFPPLVDI